jgi:hypothetical protein
MYSDKGKKAWTESIRSRKEAAFYLQIFAVDGILVSYLAILLSIDMT